MSAGPVQLAVEDGIAYLTLARPQTGNAIDDSLVIELREHAEELASRNDVRAVVLSAQGEHFCVGGDLSYFATLGDDVEAAMRKLADEFHVGVAALRTLDAPLIAVVQGAAAGGGLSLVCAADLVLAAELARFTMAYTAAGLSPDGGGSWFLPRLVGLRLATEMLFTNRRLSATEAEANGIVTEVIADSELDAAAEKLARQIAAGPTAAFGSVKQLLQASGTNSLAGQLEAEAVEMPATHRSPMDARAWPRSSRSADLASAPPPLCLPRPGSVLATLRSLASRVRASKRVRTRTTARARRHEEHASPSQLGGGLNGVAADLHMWILARQNYQVVPSAQLRC